MAVCTHALPQACLFGLFAAALLPALTEVDASTSVRLLHITDSHISLVDESKPRSSRMHSAFVRTKHRHTKAPTSPQQEFARLIHIAREQPIDLVVLGGDIFNFPSNKTLEWVLEQLRVTGTDYVYVSGNHDWLLEGQRSAPSYDFARVPELSSTFRPLYEMSLASGGPCYNVLGHWTRPGAGIMYGCAIVKGLLLLFVDNSNFQVDEDQLEFVRVQLEHARPEMPIVVLLHIPLMLPGMDKPPKEICGHEQWGAANDALWQLEGRPKWPAANSPSTLAFRELVQSQAAPAGQIVAILSGHTHGDAAVNLASATSSEQQQGACSARACRSFAVKSEGGTEQLVQATDALQYVTSTASEGAYRILTVDF